MQRSVRVVICGVVVVLWTTLAWGFSIQGETGFWQYRMPIHIDYTNVPSDLTNFPVLVAFDTAVFDFSKARSDGYDIRFTLNSDGTSVLKYERERHDASLEEWQWAEYWVKIPSVSSSSDTYFYMFYGNPSASDGQDKTNVWDSSFKMVQHLHEESGTHYDSTSNANDGTCYGGVSQGSDGKIDNADYFDGIDDYVEVADNATLDITDSITVEAWVEGSGLPTDIISRGAVLEYDTDQGTHPALFSVDDTHFLCAYSGLDQDGYAVIVTADFQTATVSSGTKHEFDTVDTYRHALSQVDSTHYLCAYTGENNDGYAVILTVDTDSWTVSSGTAHEFDTDNGWEPALASVDGTHHLCVYQGESGDGYAVILTVDTDNWTVSSGTKHEFDTGDCDTPALCQIDYANCLCAYKGQDDDGYAVVLTVDEMDWTVTSGTKYEFDTTSCSYPALAEISSNYFLCAYDRAGGTAVILTVGYNGHELSSGTPHTFDATSIAYPAISKIDDRHFLFAYRGQDDDGYAVIATVEAWTDTITSGATQEFEADNWESGALCRIDPVSHLCVYGGPDATTYDGYAAILSVEIGPIVWKGCRDGYCLSKDGGSGADSLFGISGLINDKRLTVSTGWGWHHVVLTYDRSDMRLYVDGMEQASMAYTAAISTNAENLKIGDKVDGTIDEVRISNPVRDAAWIEACYSNQSSPSTFCIFGEETLASLTRLGVRGLDCGVLLEWETEAEVGTAGFNVLRAESPEGPWLKLNEGLIPSQGSSWEGASYDFSDTTREAGTVYWYCVEEVDTGGGTERYPTQLVWDEGLTDADGDGMPDVWEQKEGIDTGSDADADADADHDGATNLQEYLAGTSPVDPEDCPQLRIERDKSGHVFTLAWPGRAGRTYKLVGANSLTQLLGGSAAVLSVTPATSNRLMEFERDDGAENRQRFYRLIISPPR